MDKQTLFFQYASYSKHYPTFLFNDCFLFFTSRWYIIVLNYVSFMFIVTKLETAYKQKRKNNLLQPLKNNSITLEYIFLTFFHAYTYMKLNRF